MVHLSPEPSKPLVSRMYRSPTADLQVPTYAAMEGGNDAGGSMTRGRAGGDARIAHTQATETVVKRPSKRQRAERVMKRRLTGREYVKGSGIWQRKTGVVVGSWLCGPLSLAPGNLRFPRHPLPTEKSQRGHRPE